MGLRWSSTFNIGIDEVDKDHQRFFEIVDEFHSTLQKYPQKEHKLLADTINALRDHSLEHFAKEEEHAKKCNYPNLEKHKDAHQSFLDKCDAMSYRLQRGSAVTSLEFLAFLEEWIVNHILQMDQALHNYITKQDKVA